MLLTRQGSRNGKYGYAKPQAWLGDPWNPTASAIVPPGSSAGVNALSFRPPSQGSAVVISAIKFQIQPQTPGALTSVLNIPAFGYYGILPVSQIMSFGYQLGHAVSVAFALAKYNAADSSGGMDPTSGDAPAIGALSGRVPIGTLCDSRNLMSDTLPGGYSSSGAAPFTGVNPISEYRWDLPRPFYVPPGYIFLPQFYGLGGNITGQAGTVAAGGPTSVGIPLLRVQVSYEGALLDPNQYGDDGDYTDDVTRIPFAAAYLGTPVPNTNGSILTYTDTSDETELTNNFDLPACVSQINGKLVSGTLLSDAAIEAGNGFSLRMLASNHNPLVRDYLAWRTVFDRQTRAWDLSGAGPYQLDPGESLITSVTGTLGSALTDLGNPGGVQPVIVATGFREYPLSAL